MNTSRDELASPPSRESGEEPQILGFTEHSICGPCRDSNRADASWIWVPRDWSRTTPDPTLSFRRPCQLTPSQLKSLYGATLKARKPYALHILTFSIAYSLSLVLRGDIIERLPRIISLIIRHIEILVVVPYNISE